MSLFSKAMMALSVCALGSVAQAQDTGDSQYATGLRTLLPAGLFTHDQAPAANCNSCTTGACDSSCNHSRVGIFGDVLYMKLHNGDVPYALPVDGLGPQSLPTGNVGMVGPKYDFGYRFGVWFAPMELLSLRAQYLSWNSATSDSIDAADGSILRALTMHPSTDNTALDSLTASAQVSTDLQIIDVDGLVRLVDCGPWTVHGVGGFRYARLRQFFQANYFVLGDTQVNANNSFEGIGPRLGVETAVSVRGGLGVYGKGYLNLLIGNFDTEYSQQNVFQAQLANTGFSQSRLVPNLELELGGSWTGMNDHLSVSVGYMISSWGNMVSTNGLIEAVQLNTFQQNRNNLRDTLVIDGIVARVELRF